jgi:hypothetical protein
MTVDDSGKLWMLSITKRTILPKKSRLNPHHQARHASAGVLASESIARDEEVKGKGRNVLDCIWR